MTVSKSILIAAAIAALTSSLPSQAMDNGSDDRSIDVSIKDYNLTKIEDAKLVMAKIERAAYRACRFSNQRESLRMRLDREACQDAAVQSAVVSIGAPILTGLLEADAKS
ncbi:MAG: UrcA family protein [Pseudomonadota bacterium]